MNLTGADMQMREMQDRLAAVTAERDAAVSALTLATGTEPGRGTGVWVPLETWTAMHTERERYGADQWRRGNAGKEPQEFSEWSGNSD